MTRRNKTTVNTDRHRGSIVDAVTLLEYPFQFEPRSHKDRASTKFGEKNIIGHRLHGFHWVGGGASDVEITIYLVCAAQTNFNNPTPDMVGDFRAAQLGDYQRMILVDTGEENPDGTAKTQWVKNPVPPPVVDSPTLARERLREAASLANKAVMRQIRDLKKLLEPQDDLGAPHPLFINMGGLYTGQQFLLCDIDVQYLARNLETMEPYEAEISMKFHVLGERAKYSGSGAKS